MVPMARDEESWIETRWIGSSPALTRSPLTLVPKGEHPSPRVFQLSICDADNDHATCLFPCFSNHVTSTGDAQEILVERSKTIDGF